MTEFPDIKENYDRITERISAAMQKNRKDNNIKLMAVVKTVSPERIKYALSLGIKLVGENRAQEMLNHASQIEDYNKKCELHFIGTLQSNKVKHVLGGISAIESVDSLKLASVIDKEAGKCGRIIDILVEINIGCETTKGGIDPGGLDGFMESVHKLRNVRTRGLMTIPPIGNSDRYFGQMQELYEQSKDKYGFDTLSMGMSGDYENAVRFGSNIVRIGSALFGNR